MLRARIGLIGDQPAVSSRGALRGLLSVLASGCLHHAVTERVNQRSAARLRLAVSGSRFMSVR